MARDEISVIRQFGQRTVWLQFVKGEAQLAECLQKLIRIATGFGQLIS